jgi:CubicO group peptidase (beta-lactamase class C family)
MLKGEILMHYKKEKILFFGIVLIILIGNSAPIISGLEGNIINKSETKFDDFDTKIMNYMKMGKMPSLVCCVIKNNTTVWSNAYGYRDYYKKKETTVETVYPIASITKSITATAIMQINESGLIGLDDNVSKYLGFDLKNPRYPETNITFRMLLAHDSSIADGIFGYTALFYFLKYPIEKIDEYFLPGGMFYYSLLWNTYMPGTCSWYSTINTEILGYLVTRITNQSFIIYCQDNIFNPLEIHNTSFFFSNYKNEQLANLYRYFLGFYIRMPCLEGTLAGGGLKTTISDFSHYLTMLTSRGVYNGIRILREESVDEMQSIQYPGHYDEGFLHGFGWYRNDTHGGHGGSAIGGRAEMRMRYSDRVAVAYFWNQNSFILSRFISTPEEQKRARILIEYALFKKADDF